MSKRANKRRAEQRKASVAKNELLGWRIDEWIKLTGTSRPTVYRHAKLGKLKVVYLGEKIPIIPRSEAVRLGLLDA
jgi:hypothetical protein